MRKIFLILAICAIAVSCSDFTNVKEKEQAQMVKDSIAKGEEMKAQEIAAAQRIIEDSVRNIVDSTANTTIE